MTDFVVIKRRSDDDPLARDEEDIVERLQGMADDALAGRNEDAVDREADTFRALLGWKR